MWGESAGAEPAAKEADAREKHLLGKMVHGVRTRYCHLRDNALAAVLSTAPTATHGRVGVWMPACASNGQDPSLLTVAAFVPPAGSTSIARIAAMRCRARNLDAQCRGAIGAMTQPVKLCGCFVQAVCATMSIGLPSVSDATFPRETAEDHSLNLAAKFENLIDMGRQLDERVGALATREIIRLDRLIALQIPTRTT
ncbi:hypothetical protein PSPO01_06568 [Paraphaeosphaeria sporulosa]